MTNHSDNIYFACQFIAIVLLSIAFMLAITNNVKKKEIVLLVEKVLFLRKFQLVFFLAVLLF
jgi:hypothetical protein